MSIVKLPERTTSATILGWFEHVLTLNYAIGRGLHVLTM